jgi:hypothetical protein
MRRNRTPIRLNMFRVLSIRRETQRLKRGLHIIEILPSPANTTYILLILTAMLMLDSKTLTSPAIQIPSSRYLQVVLIWQNYFWVHRAKTTNVSDSFTSLQVWFIPWSLADRMLSTLTTLWRCSSLIIKVSMQMNVRTYCDILIWWRMLYYHIDVLLYCDIVVLSYSSVVFNCHIVVMLYWDIDVLSYCSAVLYCHIVVLLYCNIVMLSY